MGVWRRRDRKVWCVNWGDLLGTEEVFMILRRIRRAAGQESERP